MTFAGRSLRNTAITVAVAASLLAFHEAYRVALYREAFLSGWLLLATVLVLSVFRVRKSITMLPIGSAAGWMQLHIYGGLLSVLIFVVHVDWQVPGGLLELILASLFVIVAASGIFGLALMRSLPRRLARRGEEVIWERIPVFIRELRDEAEETALQSTSKNQSSTISDFYVSRLHDFFREPRNLLLHLMGSDRALAALLDEFDNMDRYLHAREGEFAEQLRELVLKKNDLDFHYSLQLSLKAWLLVHVPLTFSLLIIAVVHLILAYAFSGGA